MTIMITVMIVMAFSITANAEEAKWEELAADYTGKTVILQSNDVHGALDGYQYIAGLKNELEKRHAHVILVDSGDFIQGSIYVSEDKGASAISLMNECGYDYITIGNHEFDYGTDQMLTNLNGLDMNKTHILCSNLVKTDGTGQCAFDENSVYSGNNDLKIGFYGVLSDSTKTSCMPGNIEGMDFQTKADMYDTLNDGIDNMETQGADVIIGIAHFGVDKLGDSDTSMDLYAGTKGSIGDKKAALTEDEIAGKYLILDGHSHTVMTEGKGGEPIMSTGTKFMNVGVVVIDEKSESIEDHFLYRLRETDSTSAKYIEGLPSDAGIKAKADELIADVDKKYSQVIASSETDLNGEKAMKIMPDGTIVRGNRDGETNLGDLNTEALMWYVTVKDTRAQLDPDNTAALYNGGSIRAGISKGDVTRKNILDVMPFGNTICIISVRGDKLLEALEASMYAAPSVLGGFPQISNMEISLDESAEYIVNEEPYPGSTYYGPKAINRIKSVKIHGKELDPEKTYNVVTNNFVAAGGDTYYAFTEAEVIDTGISDEDVVEQFLKDETGLNGKIKASDYGAPLGRIIIVHDAADKVRPAVKDSVKNAAKILKTGDYTKKSAAAVEEAMSKAQGFIDDQLASASDLSDAGKKIEEAVKALVPHDEKYNSAYSTLAADIIAARREVKASDYKAKSYSRLSEALAAAKELLDDRLSTAADLTKANSTILSAWASLEMKDAQTIKVKTSKKTVRRSALRRKAKTVKAVKVSGAKGTVSYKKLSGSKKLTVDKTSGKIKVKKGTRKGTYRIKVKVSAAGDGNYMAGSKTVTVKVKVR